jgi:CBS domain-containing protein
MKKLPIIKEIMDKVFVKFDADTSVKEAVTILTKKHLLGACVVDKDENILGVLSEKACFRLYVQAYRKNNPAVVEQARVRDIMRPELKTVTSSMNLFDVAQIFLKNEFRRMPVVDNGILVGQVTQRDILRTIQDYAWKEKKKD